MLTQLPSFCLARLDLKGPHMSDWSLCLSVHPIGSHGGINGWTRLPASQEQGNNSKSLIRWSNDSSNFHRIVLRIVPDTQ